MTPAQALSIATKFFERSGLPRGTRLTDDHCATIASTFIGVGDALKFPDPNMLELEALFLLSMLGAHKISWMNVEEKEKPWVVSKSQGSDDLLRPNFRMHEGDKLAEAKDADIKELTEYVRYHIEPHGTYTAVAESRVARYALVIAAKLKCNLLRMDESYVFSSKPLPPPNDCEKIEEEQKLAKLTEYVLGQVAALGYYVADTLSPVGIRAATIAKNLKLPFSSYGEGFYRIGPRVPVGFTRLVSDDAADFMVQRLDTHHSKPAHGFSLLRIKDWMKENGFILADGTNRVLQYKRGDETIILRKEGVNTASVFIAYSSLLTSTEKGMDPLLLWYGGATTGKA